MTDTHPATTDRVVLVEDFLAGRANGMIALFQSCLASLGLPIIQKEFTAPAIGATFDDILTYRIANEQELHGLEVTVRPRVTLKSDAEFEPACKTMEGVEAHCLLTLGSRSPQSSPLLPPSENVLVWKAI
ncbi:hypothetical protein ACVWXO_005020 [Bradyrhizobium sp. LM2.7]